MAKKLETILKVVCDSAFLSVGNKLNIIGVFDKITAPKLPAIHNQMSVALILSGEREQKFDYYFDIQDPSRKKIIDLSATPREASTGGNGRINIVLNIGGIKLENYGPYTINVYVGNLKESLSFDVVRSESSLPEAIA